MSTVRTETRYTVYHSDEWMVLADAGWKTMTVDGPNADGIRLCKMIREYDRYGCLIR